MGMPGPLEWLILIGIAFLVVGTVWESRRRRWRQQVRGFEVKPTAGGEQAPALRRERDDHHG